MDEINLQEFLYNLRKKIPVLIIATLIGAILGGVNLIFMTKPMYESSTTLILVKSNSESNSSITQTDIVLNQKLIGTYSEIIKSRSVAKEVID